MVDHIDELIKKTTEDLQITERILATLKETKRKNDLAQMERNYESNREEALKFNGIQTEDIMEITSTSGPKTWKNNGPKSLDELNYTIKPTDLVITGSGHDFVGVVLKCKQIEGDDYKELILSNQRKAAQYDIMTKYVVDTLTGKQIDVLNMLLDENPLSKNILKLLHEDKK